MIVLVSFAVNIVCVTSVNASLHRGVSLALASPPAGLGVLLKEKVVGRGQMVVLIVFDGSLNRLIAEAKGSLHLEQEFLIYCSRHRVMIVVLVFWLVQAVPGVLLKTFNIDALGRVCHEDL